MKVVDSLKRDIQFALMDNGKKADEVNVYSKYLPVGSVLITHDWNIEVSWDQIKDVLTARGFVPIYEHLGLYLKSNTRAFFRKSISG